MRAHEEEIERQRDAVDAVDAEAAEEGRINRDLATVMVARLDAGRRAAEKLLGVLQVRILLEPTPGHIQVKRTPQQKYILYITKINK